MSKQFEDEFFQRGYEDYFEGVDCEECPWDEGTDGEYGWKHGWKEASEEDI